MNNIQVLAGKLDADGGTTIQLAGTNKITGSYAQNSAALAGDGTLEVEAGGDAVIADGSWTGISVTVAGNGGLFFTDGDLGVPFVIRSTTITNNGQLTIGRLGGIQFGDTATGNFATINNTATGIMTVVDGSLGAILNPAKPGQTPTFTNAGTVWVGDPDDNPPPAALLDVGFPMTNSGTVTVLLGSTLQMSGGYDFTQTSGTTKLSDQTELIATNNININGGSLQLTGDTAEITAKTLTNKGTLTLPDSDALTLTGDYTQTANGTLAITTANGNSTSKLKISGNATLNGTLQATVQDSVGKGDTYKFMTFGQSAGTFSTFTTQNAALQKYEVQYNPKDATLVPKKPGCNADDGETDEDTPISINVLDNDLPAVVGDTLSILSVTAASHGTVAIVGSTILYTPFANYNGPDTFNYTVQDEDGGTADAEVDVTVDPVNDAPVASNAAAMTPQNTAVDIDLRSLVTDVETAPDDMTFTVSNAQHGTVILLGDGHTAEFTPASGYHGVASFDYTATDTGDGTSAPITSGATATISVNAPPTASDLAATIHAGTSVTLNPMWTDADGDSVTINSVTQGGHGTVAPTTSGVGLIYTATDPTYTGSDTFQYTISDGHGGLSTGTVTITLTNTAPEAFDVSISIHAGTATTVYLMYMDPDGDTVTISSYTQGTHGTVATSGTGLSYTPTSPTYVGSDSFNYTVDDGHGGSATATVHVTLTNTAPSAPDASVFTQMNTPVTVLPMLSDSDGDTVSITSVTTSGTGAPAHGTVSIVGGGTGVQYIPALGFVGTDSFTYTMSDGHGGFTTGRIIVTVGQIGGGA